VVIIVPSDSAFAAMVDTNSKRFISPSLNDARELAQLSRDRARACGDRTSLKRQANHQEDRMSANITPARRRQLREPLALGATMTRGLRKRQSPRRVYGPASASPGAGDGSTDVSFP
jgi:hypothetical protein